MLSALSVRVTGEKGGKYIKSKIKYTDEPLGKLRIVDDFLPPPEDLLFKGRKLSECPALLKVTKIVRGALLIRRRHILQWHGIWGWL